MDISLYFTPVDFTKVECDRWNQKKYTLGGLLEKNHKKLSFEKAELVIFGVEEDRNSIVAGAAKSPNKIREHLYNLNRISSRLKIIDLGNIKIGKTINDTYFALRDICEYIREQGKTTIIIGGSQDLTFGITKAYGNEPFKLTTVDPKFDFKKGIKTINSETYLSLIFEKQRNMIAHSLLAYQAYFTDALELDQLNKKGSDTKRLGQIRYDMTQVEPILRDTDVLSFDINAIRSVDAPGQYFSSPNGLYAEEACQLTRYAGLGDQINIAGFFNIIPKDEKEENTTRLTAQIIWHFIDGFYNRTKEKPEENTNDFNQFVIDIEDIDIPLTFYQSRKTNRWWMEIQDIGEEKKMIIPCTENDYQQASRNDIPDRWWKNLRLLDRC